jgi:hypothetical protein
MNNILHILVAISLILLVGCAESRQSDKEEDTDTGTDADTDSDTDIDTDVDTDSDTDSDSDTDTDTDTDTNTECVCFNAALDCCDGCYYEGTDYVCDSQYEEERECAPLDTCQGAVLVRHKERYCDGIVGGCAGAAAADFGTWNDAGACGTNEVCLDGDAGVPSCDLDLVQCPAGYGDTICQPGGVMPDCPFAGPCPVPPPSMNQSVTFGAIGSGEVIKLDFYVVTRGGFFPGMPFTDITATVTHGGTVVNLYNGYVGEEEILVLTTLYDFPITWYLPHTWGQEVGGIWDIDFEDSAFSGSTVFVDDFNLTQWCITILPAGAMPVQTSGAWAAPAAALGNIPVAMAPTIFEMQLDDSVDATGQDVWLELDITHPVDTDIGFGIIAADGTQLVLKAPADPTIESYYEVTGLSTNWMTGRWSLQIVNTGTGSTTTAILNSWSINVGTLPSGSDAGMDGGK